jgi:hypothetical protein
MMNKCTDCGWHAGIKWTPKKVLIHENNLIARCWHCWEISKHPSTPIIKFIVDAMIGNWNHLAKTEAAHDFCSKKVEGVKREERVDTGSAS